MSDYRIIQRAAKEIVHACSLDEQQFDASEKGRIREQVITMAIELGIAPMGSEERDARLRLTKIRNHIDAAIGVGEE